MTTPRWLLFIHQIPPKPDYFRVKVRRRLQRIGAVALKNSVYVLPRTADTTEDLQWLRRAVVDEGGEAAICAASFVEGMSDGELEGLFRAQSDAEYGEIVAAAEAMARPPSRADVQRLGRRFEQAEARDFFGAERRGEAQGAVESCRTELRSEGPQPVAEATSPDRPRGAVWVTRAGVFVDRMASAWLIRRFIDPDARFTFVPSGEYRPKPGELRFDMFDGEYTHEGDACTFEVLAARFAIDEPAVRAIGEVVHDIDCKDDKFGREETAGVASLVRGITLAHADDDERIEAGHALFEGLYASFRHRT